MAKKEPKKEPSAAHHSTSGGNAPRPESLVSITIWCPELEKEIVVTPDQWDWSADVNECELCGSHGKIKVSVSCTCKKKYHEIELNSW